MTPHPPYQSSRESQNQAQGGYWPPEQQYHHGSSHWEWQGRIQHWVNDSPHSDTMTMPCNRPPHQPWSGSQNGARDGPPRTRESQFHNGPGQHTNNNQQWQGGTQDWMNGPPQYNNFGRNGQQGDNYPQQRYEKYPSQQHQQHSQNSHPRREISYSRDRSCYSRNPQTRHNERFHPYIKPKEEVIEEDWDQEILQSSQMNQNYRGPKIEPGENWDRDGHKNQRVPQNKPTDSMSDQPMLKNLIQHIKTSKRFQPSRHPSANNTHDNRNSTNAPLNKRNGVVANTSTNVGVQHNSSANDGAAALHRKGLSTQKNLNDKTNESASVHKHAITPTVLQNKSTPSGELSNTSTVLLSKSTPSASNAKLVPKLTLQKSNVSSKDWSIKKLVNPNQQIGPLDSSETGISSIPSHSCRTDLLENSSIIENNNSDSTNSDGSAALNTKEPIDQNQLEKHRVVPDLLESSSIIENTNLSSTNSDESADLNTKERVIDQNQLEKHEVVSGKVLHKKIMISASFLYGQNKELNSELLGDKIPVIANDLNSSNFYARPSTSSTEVCKPKSVSASHQEKVHKPGPVHPQVRTCTEKEKEGTSTQQNSVSLVSFSVNRDIATNENSDSELSNDEDSDSELSNDEDSSSPIGLSMRDTEMLCENDDISPTHSVAEDGQESFIESSRDGSVGRFSSSSERSTTSSKRTKGKIPSDPNFKRSKTIPENAEHPLPTKNQDPELEEIIEIADDDTKETVSTSSVQQVSQNLSTKSKSEVTVSALSNTNQTQKKTKRKNSDSVRTPTNSKVCKLTDNNNQKLPRIKSNSRVESRSTAMPVSLNSRGKTKPIASSSKNSAPIVVDEALPTVTLPIQQIGKQENILNTREPRVLLKRLTPAEILQFSASTNIVEKATLLYQKDLLKQMKYFTSFVYHLNNQFNYKVSLGSEVDDPKDLCNKVLYVTRENSFSLIQIKYLKKNSDQCKITYKALSNPEFDIKKLWKDFLNFHRTYQKKIPMCIFTNLDLSVESFRSNGVQVLLQKDWQYRFFVDTKHDLYKKFLKCLTLPKLAELLVECIKHGKNKNFNTELIKKYHLALVKENVFRVQAKKNVNGKPSLIAKFHPDFVGQNGLSNGAKELHRLISNTIKTEIAAATEFTLTSDQFGKDCNLDPNPRVDISEVADALVNQEERKLLIAKKDLKKIAGHVLQKVEGNIFGFSKTFYNGENLSGNLKGLRMRVKNLLELKKLDFLEFCKSTISIKDFCTDHPVQRLPDEDGESLFKEFFECFVFEKLEKYSYIIDKDISSIDDEACANAVQEELLKQIKTQNLSKDSLISMKNLISKCKVTSTLCQQPRMDIQFHEETLSDLQCRIPQHGIVLCITNSLALTKLKIQQLCTNALNFREGNEILFITNKTLLDMTIDVLKALAHDSTNVLVIQCSEAMPKNSQVLTKIVKSLQNQCENSTSMKSVIIIGDQKSCSPLTNIIDTKIIDNERSFDLSEDSKAKLLEVDNVSLQHRRLSLKSLLPDEHVSTLLKNSEILRLLLTGKLIIGKDLARPSSYKKSFFKAQIKQCIVINPAIFHEPIDDVFLISNIDRKDLEEYVPVNQRVLSPNDVPASMRINARFILLGFNVPASFFDGYAEKNHHQHNVHLLRYESGSFVWEKTQGNNTDLLRNRLEDTNDLYKSQKTMDVVKEGPKTVIICGEAGSGKSVCLYDIAKKTKHLYKTSGSNAAFWPLQVSLDRTRLSRFVKRDTNIPLEPDFVEKFLPDYLELDEVQSKLLAMILNNQLNIKLVLLFDNYEELPSSHRRFVVQLLQELQVSFCERVYVTSSPSTRSELEETLAVFAYSLEFSEVEKVQFLQSFWSKACEDVDFTNEAGDFVGHYGEELTATPLQLRMLAATYTPNEEEDEEFKVVETREELYKLYVEHKGLKDEESASLFSLRKVLDDDQLKTLHLQHKNPKKGFTMPDDLHHRTFYEYFAAKYLATKNHSKCIDELLDSASPLFFETYFAQLNAGDETTRVIGEFAVNGHLNVVKMMLSHCEVKLQLSNVICSNNPNAREVVRFLLNYYNDTKDEIMLHGEFKKAKYAESSVVRYVNRREKPRKETPLEVAAKLKKIPIACELLLKGANIKSISKEFTFEIARYIADEMSKPDDESAWLRPIAEKLLKLQPTAFAHLNKTSKYPRLLSYFFTHGRVELVNLLLKNDRERYNVLVAKVDDKSPLDLVNESRMLSDDERLEIAKYIVSNVGDDLERRDRYYLSGVLKTAAECNHERTFEYFIGKYPERHMGFLQRAMRSNRLDLIKFLMRKTDRMMYPEENTALHRAVSLGVSPMTINFLVNRGGIDNMNKNGETPLCVAFKEGQELELIEYLIKKDAHLFSTDELGLYPWCYAILDESKYTSEDQANIMKYLQGRMKLRAPETEQKISFESDQKRKEVARKVKYFQKPESFVLPNLELHMALKSNDESWIRFLVQRGANVNQTEADGRTPLHVAIEFKRYKLAKMLLDHGAMFNVKDKKRLTPLKLLMKNGDESKEAKEMKELLEAATELFTGNEKYTTSTSRHLLNCRDKDGRTLLHVAAKSGNRPAIRDIIKQSKEHCVANNNFPALDVNAKDAKDNTALNLVKSQNVDVAKELLLNGAIFEPASTALLQHAGKLLQAVKHKDAERVRELVRTECLTNARDEAGKSCLHWAASYDSREIVQLVLAVRVSDVDAVDSSLRTPLHYAVENDNIASVLLLLKAGASYDVKDKLGRRPFDVDDKTNESVTLLWRIHQMFLDIKSDEPRILANDNPEALLEYLLEIETNWSVTRDVAVNITDSKKNTLLHIAARYDFTSVVENLLKQGAIYNAKNKWKKTPESMAISTRQLFKSLTRAHEKRTISSWMHLDPEIVVNVRFNSGYTLLHDCAAEGRKEEVRWLVENGADVKATSNRGSKIRYNKEKYPEIFEILGDI